MCAAIRALLATVLLLLARTALAAEVLTFEDLDPGAEGIRPIPASYAGFEWGEFAWITSRNFPETGYETGTFGNVSLFTAWAYDLRMSDGRFNFLGAHMTSALADSWPVQVEGWRDGVPVYVQTVTVIRSAPTWFDFEYLDVDTLWFRPLIVLDGEDTQKWHVVIDNLTYSRGAVDDVPPTLALGAVPALTPASSVAISGVATDASGIASGAVAVGTQEFPVAFSPTGDFSIEVPLAEGDNTIVVSVTDSAGNLAEQTITVTRDSTPPALTVIAPSAGAAFGASAVSVSASVSDASLPLGVTFNGVPAVITGSTATGTVVLFTEGPNVILAEAVDAAGNRTTSVVNVLLDLTAPVVTVDVANGSSFGPLPGDLVPFAVTVDDDTTTQVVFSYGGSMALPRGGLTVYGAAPLTPGSNTISFAVTDEVGLTVTVPLTVVYDIAAPEGSFASLSDGAFLRMTAEIAVEASDAETGVASVMLSVDGGAPFSAVPSGSSFVATLDTALLADGDHDLAATLLDGVGNLRQLGMRIVTDNTAPVLSLASPAPDSFARGTITLQATASDATSGVGAVRFAVNGVEVGACDGASCSVSFDTTTLPDGPFQVTATALDRAGNAAEPLQRQVIADNTAPARFLVSPAPGAIVKGTFSVMVDVQDPSFASAECFAGGESLGASTQASFTRQVDSMSHLDGELQIRCTATDQAGNTATESAVVVVRNWTLKLTPQVLHVKSKCWLDALLPNVALRVEGQSLALLMPAADQDLTLVVPGGSVPLAERPAPPTKPGDRDFDGIPDVKLKFNRATIVRALRASGAEGLVTVRLMTGDHQLGTTTLRVW